MKACLNVQVDIVRLLLNYSPNLELTNKEGISAIATAVVKGSLEIVQLLIEANANIHSTRVR